MATRDNHTAQRQIPAVFMRGGTSKGVFFHAHDMPDAQDDIDTLLLSVLGSPDPYGRQLDGMGGGISSLSKGVIIDTSERADIDILYLFAQVAVDRSVVDYSAPCGNLSAAVGPFAVEQGLVETDGDSAEVRILDLITDTVIVSRFPLTDGQPAVTGELLLPGLAGPGAAVELDYLEPAGSRTSGLLPSGNAVDSLTLPDGTIISASLIDAATPMVFLDAAELGLTATEAPDELEKTAGLMARLDAIRRAGAVAMGLAASPEAADLSAPKVAILAPPSSQTILNGRRIEVDEMDISARAVSMERIHRALPLTSTLCLAAAAAIDGSIPNQLCAAQGEVRAGSPSGVIPVAASVRRDGNAWQVDWVRSYRTARTLMSGMVHVPKR
jgi:2-methylaconitate cis-trans-isomerase PrpF